MQFTLTVNLDNAAFEDDMELGNILSGVQKKVRYADLTNTWSFPVYDTNGNKVGTCSVSEE